MFVKYYDLIDLLNNGREIEFVINGKNYSITNYNGHWYFNNDSERIYTKLSVFEDEKELIANLLFKKIDDISLKEIFDEKLVEKDKLVIL